MTGNKILNVFLACIVCTKGASVTTSLDTNGVNMSNEGIEVKHENGLDSFFDGEPFERNFYCKVPKLKFENRFEWLYQLSNGSYTPLITEPSTPQLSTEPSHYVDSVKVKFTNKDITHIVCLAYSKDNGVKYNNTFPVYIREALKPKILNPTTNRSEGKNIKLTCFGEGDPLTFTWLKNGQHLECISTETVYSTSKARSTLILEPSSLSTRDNASSNKYTCVVENFLGSDSYTFELKTDEADKLE